MSKKRKWRKKRTGTSNTKKPMIRSEGHEIYSMHVNKVLLSPFETKRWIADDGVHTLAYGHKEYRRKLCVWRDNQ